MPDTTPTTVDDLLAAALPSWEAVYEPGNVSDYLIGYANTEAAAKGAAIAWVLSQSDKDAARLEWASQGAFIDGDHDHWDDLIERHDDGIDTGVGVTVRRRVRPYTAADFDVPARLVLGTTDQQPTTADRRARWEAAAHAAGREVDRNALAVYMAVADEETRTLRHKFDVLGGDYDTIKATAEAHRLALSEALGLGTGAPWDAIRDRAAELGAAPVDRAAVLREAADAALTMPTPDCAEMSSLTGAWRAGLWAAVDRLRRMADEAQQPECAAAVSGSCLAETQSDGACDTEAGECVHGGRPAVDRPDAETEAQPFYRGGRCPVMVEGGGRCEKNADHRGGRWPDDPHTPEGHGRPIDQPDTETEAAKWAGATELAPDREIRALAATGLVGYRQGNGRLLHCLAHKPAPASRWADFHEVTADDLDDGGMCVHPRCGRDLLAAWPAP